MRESRRGSHALNSTFGYRLKRFECVIDLTGPPDGSLSDKLVMTGAEGSLTSGGEVVVHDAVMEAEKVVGVTPACAETEVRKAAVGGPQKEDVELVVAGVERSVDGSLKEDIVVEERSVLGLWPVPEEELERRCVEAPWRVLVERRLVDDGVRGEKIAETLRSARTLKELGLGLCWLFFEGRRSGLCQAWIWQIFEVPVKSVVREQLGAGSELFPFPHVWARLQDKFSGSRFEDVFLDSLWSEQDRHEAWEVLCTLFCQQLHGLPLSFVVRPPRKKHRVALKTISQRVSVILGDDVGEDVWGPADIRKDLLSKDLGYAGEEIGKVEQLCVEQILPSLPPPSRGGSIRLTDWLSEGSAWLLDHPGSLMVEDCGQELPPLKGRVHIKSGERLSVARLLVERHVCVWRKASETLRFRGEAVRNGLFGVVKQGKFINSKPVLRVIMNLIPSNALFRPIQGAVHRLPSICQWTTLMLGPDEHVEISQADITSAFYLFQIPPAWQCNLPFGIEARGSQLGVEFEANEQYVLCSNVLPMGWHSAVGLMEEAAERLLLDSGLRGEQAVSRVSLLPAGFTECIEANRGSGNAFWHIYLDNFAAGQRVKGEPPETEGGRLHRQAEAGWNAGRQKRLLQGKQHLPHMEPALRIIYVL